jgi:hypothetical protein
MMISYLDSSSATWNFPHPIMTYALALALMQCKRQK